MTLERTYVVTTAINDARVEPGFWKAIQTYCEVRGAELLVVAGLYRNPSVRRSRVAKEARYTPVLEPYLVREARRLAPNLVLRADVPIQPTASRPLSGMEVFASESSAIIPSVKRSMRVIPTEKSMPRVLWTTGAVTRASYSRSRAGLRAAAHHILGAMVVEVDAKGFFWAREITYKRGGFIDLGTRYDAAGAREARTASLTLGDLHVGQEDPVALRAAKALCRFLRPDYLVLHDVFDCHTRSHHRLAPTDRYDGRDGLVKREVARCGRVLRKLSKTWGARRTVVVRSNHDEHLDRWLREFVPAEDPRNAPYWHELWARCYTHREETGKWPDALAMEIGETKELRFLRRDESLKVAGTEHGNHGDNGPNGARGSLQAFTKLGTKVTIGHAHTPGREENVVQVGVTAKLRMDYNRGPSGWLHAHCSLYEDGARQLLIEVDGRMWRDAA